MKIRLKTKNDIEPVYDYKKYGYDMEKYNAFVKKNGIKRVDVYGTIGYNPTIHLLSASTYVANGERIITSLPPACGTSTKNRVSSVDFKLSSKDITCEKCIKKINKKK